MATKTAKKHGFRDSSEQTTLKERKNNSYRSIILRYYDQFTDLFCSELYPRIHFLLPEMESLHETKNGKIGSSLQSLRASMT